MLFNKKLFRLAGLGLLLVFLLSAYNVKAAEGYYYQIKVYHLKDKAQEDVLDTYLKDAYVPALHKMGIKNVGVFKSIETDTAKRIYVFVPFKSLKDLNDLDLKLYNATATDANKAYIDANFKTPPYTRVETIVLSAFREMLAPAVPNLTADKAERIYELRSYESATEKYYYNKVKMFNDGDEVGLFKRLGFNAVFYASVIAGSHMPNLMYMTTFNNKADRDKHWEAFSADAYWKELSGKPEYQNNVSHADIIFLHPAAYSDF
ncbi:NIPSNAP family containing protein [Inquilinus sp. KBS0705]|nr:NIPSNAP family containing protein [Inquilinus sp. KBS0705]